MRLLVVPMLALAGAAFASEPPEPGLLFHLSGEHGLTADYAAGGDPEPNFAADVRPIPDGAHGAGLECGHTQLLSYWAPGNVYAQRGTLSFFWRSREPVGRTPFPVFRVGYADHSSWDMVWLRIDYNGAPGFDAFVTDASLARTRVSHRMTVFPGPRDWVHLAFSWDETRGVRLYVEGKLAAKQDGTAVLSAALDQFGPHSRIISPMQVQSAYNFVRGGDIDEIRVYDRMLSDENVATLARGERPGPIPDLVRSLSSADWRDEWWLRYGWNRAGEAPPPLTARSTIVRKVEIHDVRDLKRWWWKGTDGIRETTWPGVYNRSRLPGRNDYFQLPDWDCYSSSGRTVVFSMPDEPWNHIEVSGAAWGPFALLTGGADGTPASERPLFDRPRGQERTFHRLGETRRGQRLQFTNVEQETPIGELSAYYVAPGTEPTGIARLTYRLTAGAEPRGASLAPLLTYISGRHPDDERATMVALPAGAPRAPRVSANDGLPIVHIVVPADFRSDSLGQRRSGYSYTWTNMPAGLDGIALDLPALKVRPTHGDLFPLNIQVKDPLWPLRNMLDVSLSLRPGEPRTLWLDLRDRILPAGRSLYLTIAGAGADFGPASLEGAELRLVFKDRTAAAGEHVIDRFTQVRDNYAHIVEERPNTRRLTLYARFEDDLSDLLRVDPGHRLGREYWYDANREQAAPPVTLSAVPPGVPRWAFRQVENLRYLKRFVHWYIDERQIENGEFGGGLSDDGDLTNWWPGTALMGVTPEKIARSLSRQMEAFYEQGLFANGLSSIQTDELHSYEEGIQVLGQSLVLDYGNPKLLERAMETARALERLTGINAAGHRHIRSSYFSGTTISEEGVWGWSKPSSYLVLHPALSLVEFNGASRVRRLLLELADGLLAHRKADGGRPPAVRATVEFATDRDLDQPSERSWPLLWAAFRWTGDRKYLHPLIDAGPRALDIVSADMLDQAGLREDVAREVAERPPAPNDAGLRHVAWQTSGDLGALATLYEDQIRAAALREYINTEGSLWIDRVAVAHAELQRARLGGVAQVRNSTYSGHAVSWEFAAPATAESVAVLVPIATPRRVRVIAYNLEQAPVHARLTAWDIAPGRWTLAQATGGDADQPLTTDPSSRTVELERTRSLDVVLAPRRATLLDLTLVSGATAYWSRPDLALSAEDVRVNGRTMTVTVHSVGAVDAPPARVVVRDKDDRIVARGRVPALKAPLDLLPKRAEVVLRLPRGGWGAGRVTVETAGAEEITTRNNEVRVGS